MTSSDASFSVDVVNNASKSVQLSTAGANRPAATGTVSGNLPATDLSFTVEKADLLKAQKVIDGLKKEIGFGNVIATDKIGKLSIVGVGMKSHTGVAGKMFETLARESVNIEMISTSEIKIFVIVDLAKGEQAMKAVHAAFLNS